jgi:hypothetical protein
LRIVIIFIILLFLAAITGCGDIAMNTSAVNTVFTIKAASFKTGLIPLDFGLYEDLILAGFGLRMILPENGIHRKTGESGVADLAR